MATPLRLLTTTIFLVTSATTFTLDTDRIYFPDDLNQLALEIEYERCQMEPGCDPTSLRNQLGMSCTSDMLLDRVDLRIGVGEGVGGGVDVRTGVGVGGCNSIVGEVELPSTGECAVLLTQGPCPQDQWLRLNPQTIVPECQPRPCLEGQALVGGSCAPLDDVSWCPDHQQLFINEFGEGECDCATGHVFFATTNTCYRPFTQGPCQPGYVIKVSESGFGGQGVCVHNACGGPGMIPIDAQCHEQDERGNGTTCHTLNTPGPCGDGIFTIDETLNAPVCLEVGVHSIFNLPNTRRCARGSIRDDAGRCRVDFSKMYRDIRPSITTEQPKYLEINLHSILNLPNTRRCAWGYIRDKAGRCRVDFSKSLRDRKSLSERKSIVQPNYHPSSYRVCPRGYKLLGGVCVFLNSG